MDRRFGENDPTMTPEDRMLERFTKERQRASRSALFNLDDGDILTHYCKTLTDTDDFDDVGMDLNTDEDLDESSEQGRLDARRVSDEHFGGFSEDEDAKREEVSNCSMDFYNSS